MSTTAELTAFVYDVIDLDEADLPQSLIRSYMKDAFNRIIALERRWPFYETTYTLNTVAGQRDYSIGGIGSGDLREITSVLDNSTSGNRLNIISLDDAERMWHGSFDVPARPLLYTEWAEVMKLYPRPDTVYPLVVRGYRKPSYGWVTDTAQSPDCDERLHDALAYYAIAQAYKRQEDSEMHAQYKSSFDEAVGIVRKEIMRSPSYRPMIMARGGVRPSTKYWLESMGRTLGQ